MLIFICITDATTSGATVVSIRVGGLYDKEIGISQGGVMISKTS